jgi:hypothetical protein
LGCAAYIICSKYSRKSVDVNKRKAVVGGQRRMKEETLSEGDPLWWKHQWIIMR